MLLPKYVFGITLGSVESIVLATEIKLDEKAGLLRWVEVGGKTDYCEAYYCSVELINIHQKLGIEETEK